MAWTTITDPGQPISCVCSDGTLLWGVGQDDNTLFSYDPLLDTYDNTHAGFPGSTSYRGMVYDPDTGPAGSLWLFGNGDTYIYDIDTDTWDTRTTDPFVTGGRFMFACVRVGRKVICAGGDDFVDVTDGVTEYDLDLDSWAALANMPAALGECQGALVGTVLYVFGGATTAFSVYAPTVYAYDTVGDSWSTISGVAYDMDFSGFPTAAALSSGTIFAEGGNGGSPSSDTWLYDSGLDDWAAGDATPFAGLKVSVSLDDVVYLFSAEFASPAAARFGTPVVPTWSGLSEIEAELVTLPDLDPVPDVSLELTRDRSWLEQLNDAGSGSITFSNTDPALASVVMPITLVNLSVRGVLAVTLWLKRFKAWDIAPGEEKDQLTVYEGLLHLGLLDACVIDPWNGPYRKPQERDRAFNYYSPSYDDSGWITASVVTNVLAVQNDPPVAGGGATWDSGDPDSQWADDFPDGAAVDILWASDGTVSSAGVGDCYFRETFTVTNTGTHTISAACDNYGEVYLDGQLVMTPGQESDLVVGFRRTSTYAAELTAGPHLLAAKVTNAAGTGANPAGLAYTIHESNSTGALGTRILASSAAALITEYAVPPGMPMGQIINLLLAEGQARGDIPYVTTSFTDTLDTDGTTFPLLVDAATKVGTTILGALREWSDTYIDFYMAPGTTVLDVWVKGGRGTDVSADVSYHSPTDPNDESTGNLKSLVRTGEGPIANDFLVDSAVGWTRETDPVAIATDGKLEAALSLGALGTPGEVTRVTEGQFPLFAYTRVQTDIVPAPRTDAETPYVGFAGTGDTIEVQAGNHRVLSMAVSEVKETGRAQFVPTLNAALVLTLEERFAQWLRKSAFWSLGGRSKPAQPTLPYAILRGGRAAAATCMTINESFDQPDSTTIGPLLSWQTLAGFTEAKTVSNEFTLFDTTAGSNVHRLGTHRARTSLGSMFQTVEAVLAGVPVWGTGASQFDSATFELIASMNAWPTPADTEARDGFSFRLVLDSSGQWSPLLDERHVAEGIVNTFAGGSLITLSAGDVMRVEVVAGVTVTGYVNGSPVVTGSPTYTLDAALNRYAGIGMDCRPHTTAPNGTIAFDDWSASDC